MSGFRGGELVIEERREQFASQGFVVVDTGLPEETLDAAKLAEGPLQPPEHHYNKAPDARRVFEGWKSSQAVRDIAWAAPVIDCITELYGDTPRPLQTINFNRPSLMPLHQDAIHFQTRPEGRMCCAWVALEKTDMGNGPLCCVPGSQKKGYLTWQALGFHKSEVGEQYPQYHLYESLIAEEGARIGLVKPICLEKGQAVIFGLNLFHGGWPVADPKRTRYAQATHYSFHGAFGYAPMFSDVEKGEHFPKSMRWFDAAGGHHPREDRV